MRRPPILGRLNFPIPIMIEPSQIQTVLRQPERLIKNYQFLERLAEGRFTTNNDAWQKRSRLTQVFYNNATRQVPLNRLKTLYQFFCLAQQVKSIFSTRRICRF